MERDGCLTQIATVAAAFVAFSIISGVAGWNSAAWFGLGFISAALVCFWEGGRNKREPSK